MSAERIGLFAEPIGLFAEPIDLFAELIDLFAARMNVRIVDSILSVPSEAGSGRLSRNEGGFMKHKTWLVVTLVVLAATNVFAGDKEDLVGQLERTQARLLAQVEGLSEAQWNYKPAADRWSVAECVEHITAAEPMIRKMIAEAMAKPLAEDVLAGAKQDEALLKGMTDRTKKFKAPEPLIPTNRFGSPAEALAAFKKERAETIRLAAEAPDLRKMGDKHFLFGPLDAYGWFLFLSGHSERHTIQLEEVKASEGFPKG